ncbi:MAG: GntR family transcriptional regulator [Eggerthellaceae bacterium]|nr:GntR family transcriptional regulator [Eggerthellaceae bacterium]
MVELGKTIPAGDLFELDEASSIPIWLQLKNRFIYLIVSGFYLPGDQLPTVRGLAAEVEVNYNTVSKVYQSLEEDGYIVSKRRQGAFVADVSDKPGVSAAVTAEIITVEYLKRCQELGMSLEDIDAQFTASLVAAKAKRDRTNEDKGATHGAQETPRRGRVVVFPERGGASGGIGGCADNDNDQPEGFAAERAAGNGA